MTVFELYQRLEERIPRPLSCEWDNDGLMLCPDGYAEVKKALFTLDVTDEAVEYCLPLIQGEQNIRIKNGLPQHYILHSALPRKNNKDIG